jgi:hypothetical protein
LQHGYVRRRVRADLPGLQLPAIAQFDREFLGSLDEMIAGDHIAACRIDHHSRPANLKLAWLRLLWQSEKSPEERVQEQRILSRHVVLEADADHARQDTLQHSRKTGHLALCRRRRSTGKGERATKTAKCQRQDKEKFRHVVQGFLQLGHSLLNERKSA